jgi:integrase/recombinase XerC
LLNQLVRKAERRAADLDDPFELHCKRLLAEHLDDYEAYLANKRSTKIHVTKTTQRIRSVINGCQFERIDHISASRVQEFLADLRANGRSTASSNHYLRAVKMFSRWLVRDRRSNDDRLVHLSRMNADTDRRRIRRPLTTEEFMKLLQAAETGPVIQSIPGPDRAVLYILGAYTGFRRKEIASIQSRSFDFDSDPPTLTIEAAYSKHRRADVIPLRQDFAERIRDWIARKPDARSEQSRALFDIAEKRTAEMIKQDLERAGVPYIDERGHYADFHSLRKTFITNLSRAGVSPKMAQILARHSDINLTMNTYTMLGVVDQTAAIEALPPIPTIHRQEEGDEYRANGTVGGRDSYPKEVPTVVPRSAKTGAIRPASQSSQTAPDCTLGKTGQTDKATRNPQVSASSRASSLQVAPSCTTGPGRIRTFNQGIMSPLAPRPNSQPVQTVQELRETCSCAVPSVVPGTFDATTPADLPPELSSIIAAWSRLPQALKLGIAAMVQAAIAGATND